MAILIPHHLVRREDVKTARMEKDLHQFIQGAWPVLEGDNPFVDGWHIGFMCDVAMSILPHLHLRNVLINIPPRHMKSLLFTVMWQAWLWGPADMPHLRMLNASFADSLSTRDSLKVRRLIASDWYQRRWGHRFLVTKDQDAKTRFDNDSTGFRLATSTGGLATGEGGHLLNVDDAQKAGDALSVQKRETLKSWWRTTWSSRLNDKRTGCRVVTGQRLHQMDIVGVVEEQIQEAEAQGVDLAWTKVVVPARWEGKTCTVVLPGKTLTDPRTERGEPLWKEKMPDEELKKLEIELGPFGVAGQLQQRPSPEQGGIFPRGVWGRWTVKPTVRRVFHSWDAAFKKGKNNSYVVNVTAVEGTDGRLYVMRKLRRKMDWRETKVAVRAQHDRSVTEFGRVDNTLVEEKANGAAIISEFTGTIPDLVAIDPGDDSKEARANAAAPYVADKMVLLPAEWSDAEFKEWEDEFADFPNAAHDDTVDSLSQLVIWWRQNLPSQGVPVVRVENTQRPASPWDFARGSGR